MSKDKADELTKRERASLWFIAASLLVLVVVANWHLVYAATTSQPSCVAHVRTGDSNSEPGRYSAAQSSCTPQ